MYGDGTVTSNNTIQTGAGTLSIVNLTMMMDPFISFTTVITNNSTAAANETVHFALPFIPNVSNAGWAMGSLSLDSGSVISAALTSTLEDRSGNTQNMGVNVAAGQTAGPVLVQPSSSPWTYLLVSLDVMEPAASTSILDGTARLDPVPVPSALLLFAPRPRGSCGNKEKAQEVNISVCQE